MSRSIAANIIEKLESGEITAFHLFQFTIDDKVYRYTDCEVPITCNADDTQPVNDNLIGFWDMNDGSGTTVADSSGLGNDGTMEGVIPTWTSSGISEGGLDFEDGGWIDCGNGSGTTLSGIGDGSFWISMWIKAPATTTTNRYIFSKYQDATTYIQILNYFSLDRLYFRLSDGITAVHMAPDIDPFDNTWHHIVCVVNRSTDLSYFYDNGVLHSFTKDINTLNADISNTGNVAIGGRDDGSGTEFEGTLDEVRIYQGVPTDAEVLYLYNNPSGAQQTFLTRGFDFDTINYSTGEIIDSCTIKIDNLDSVMTALFVENTVTEEEAIISMIVFNDDNTIIGTQKIFNGMINDFQLDESEITMTLTSIFAKWDQSSNITHSALCRWKEFKGVECAYGGSETQCDRTYARCVELGNTDNYGGFRWIPEIEDKEIWWGPTPAESKEMQ